MVNNKKNNTLVIEQRNNAILYSIEKGLNNFPISRNTIGDINKKL